MILELILAVIFVEAVTEIIVSSKIAEGFRVKMFDLNQWLGELVHCGYCTSVWVAASAAWAIEFGLHPVADYFLALFVIHRLSNIWHEGIVRWLNRAPITFQVNRLEMQDAWQQPMDAGTSEESASYAPSPASGEGDGQELLSAEEVD